MAYKGIDISHHQGNINFDSLVGSGQVEFAIIKAGGSDNGCYKDKRFEEYYKQLTSRGIPVGAYYYAGPLFINREGGVADAKRFLDIIKGKTFEYPVYIDVEEIAPQNRAGATEAIKAFCDTMEDADYYCGIYASDQSGFVSMMDASQLTAYDKWVASWSGQPEYIKQYGLWQYLSKGRLPGINCNVDLNYSYKDYKSIIRGAGLNNTGGGGCLTQPKLRNVTVFQLSDGDVNRVVQLAEQLQVKYNIE